MLKYMTDTASKNLDPLNCPKLQIHSYCCFPHRTRQNNYHKACFKRYLNIYFINKSSSIILILFGGLFKRLCCNNSISSTSKHFVSFNHASNMCGLMGKNYSKTLTQSQTITNTLSHNTLPTLI